jgi:predicted nucleotidyltransferase component of viral defense system
MLSREQLQQAAADSGFQVESYEKAHVLVRLLEAIRAHPFLGPRMALKGGTALNLFVLGVPRLSVDIDLNYVGASDRETMLAERPRVERALEQVAGRMGLTVKRASTEHAGGKWRLTYATLLGRPGSIEVDVNFMLRTPLWPAAPRDSHPIGGEKATQVLIVEDHELAAGKLAALAARSASRDVFDAREILRRSGLDRAKLRLGFVIYGGLNRVDWREITVEHVRTTSTDVDSQLVPMLRLDVRPAKADIAAWTETLVRETRELMAAVLPLETHELEFLERLNGAGDIAPELLTGEPAMQAIVREHPGLRWKALNVKKRLGVDAGDDDPTQ